jgi:hypothetical protein
MNWLALSRIAIIGAAAGAFLALWLSVPAIERWKDRRRHDARIREILRAGSAEVDEEFLRIIGRPMRKRAGGA